jgi:hypothetical protein
MTERYVVTWVAIKTGASGQGNKTFTKKDALRICKKLNKVDVGLLVHTIKLISD